MGERTNIYLKNDNIYLYAHWIPKEELGKILKSALIRGKSRWNDRAYLNRIIFSEMIQDEVLEETGFGLASFMPDGNIDYEVDVENNLVDGVPFEEFIK
jgi:hypothetical protein